jgi:hypothetical protein
MACLDHDEHGQAASGGEQSSFSYLTGWCKI